MERTKEMKRNKVEGPKMTTRQAEIFWNSLKYETKLEFAKMYPKLINGELELISINVDDNEQIKNIVLEPKNKVSAPAKPFYGHFHQKNK